MVGSTSAPPAHAWHRGWAVHPFDSGVSEVSAGTITAWRSGTMLVRNADALSIKLAIPSSNGAQEREDSEFLIAPLLPVTCTTYY